MKFAYLASLIALSTTALAAPPPSAPQIAPPIPPTYLEVAHQLEPSSKSHEPTWSIIVQADGTWQRYDVDIHGGTYSRSGSMNKQQQDALTAALAKAKWKTTRTASACTTRFVTFDRYVAAGQQVWQTDTCDHLDGDSASAVSTIDKVLAEVTAPRPWIEIDHRADIKTADVPTWRTTLFTDGHWERHDDATRGHTAATSTGFVTPDELTNIRAAVGRATWKHTPAAAACDAMGASVDAYLVNGQEVWVQHFCEAEELDATSQKAINFISSALGHDVVR